MWTEEAIENVSYQRCDGRDVKRAAAQYNIPPSTLHDCISGKVSRSAGAVSGAPHYLDEDEGKELVS